MNYKISTPNPADHFLAVEVLLSNNEAEEIEVQLPAWRPGRYELQNFAKNLQDFNAFDTENNSLSCEKITKDRWRVKTNGCSTVTFRYTYFAAEQNAGSSFVDAVMVYVNPVNCCVYVEGRINELVTLQVAGNAAQQLACGLPSEFFDGYFHLKADDFYHLADSPFLLSEKMQRESYEVAGVEFHIWLAGNYVLPWEKVLVDFHKITQTQMDIFGEFPEKDYHFLLWMLPTAYYHGVEHRNSTMMVLGPDNQPFEEMYIDLLGLASHELFHAWNVCRIRPKELMPYDYTQENYFRTCFVAEGITTFYGDWLLHRSGVFDENQYRQELETCYRRHFESADNAKQSLTESSYDLWLDGYTKSIPDRKVSVYHKGAIASQLLNHLLDKKGKSLDDVMRLLWQRFGKPFVGYTYQDYKVVCEEVYGENLDGYFNTCIEGTQSLWENVNEVLSDINLQLNKSEEGKVSLVNVA